MKLTLQENHTELNFNYMRIDQHVETLLEFLVRRFRYYDETEWTHAIEEERILVDNTPATPELVLENQQCVTYRRPDFLEPEVDEKFDVIYDDEDFVAVSKSGDLPTSPSGRYFKNTLVHVAQRQLGIEKLYTLHRLDRETSGVVLFAKNVETAQAVAQQFRQRQVQKKYVAVLTGELASDNVLITGNLGADPHSQIRIKQGVLPEGKWSQTLFQFQESLESGAKVLVTPFTGRTHQIRVHALFLGNPIVGDKLYSWSEDRYIKWLNRDVQTDPYLSGLKERQCLHGLSLRLTHPKKQIPLKIESKDPFS